MPGPPAFRRDGPLRVARGIVALALAAATTQALSAEESWHRESAHWLETIEPGGSIRIVNRHGAVHARFGGHEGRVEILATLQYERGARPEVAVSNSGGNLEVGVERAARDEPRRPESGHASGGAARADLVVFVPAGVTLHVETERDAIDVKGLEGDLSASSVTGDITVRAVRGSVQAKSARGTISATLETAVTARPQYLSSETGDIEVHVREDADLAVHIATSGEIATDFSIEIAHRPDEEPGKRAVASIGRGAGELVLESKRGRIALFRLSR